MATPAVRTRSVAKPRKTKINSIGTVLDLDAILEAAGLTAPPVDELPTYPMVLFGEEFRVTVAYNILALMMMGGDDNEDTARSIRSVIDLVHPDDQGRFKDAIARQRSITGDAMARIIKEMIERATGVNPTDTPSASGRSAKPSITPELSAGS